MKAGPDLAAFTRRSGLDNLSADERTALRAYLAGLPVAARVREVFGSGDALAEPAVDRLWLTLDREPDAHEYRALADLFREATAYCDTSADRREREALGR